MCHMSRVRCHVSCVMCQVSSVISPPPFFDKVGELAGGGSVINGAYPRMVFGGLRNFLLVMSAEVLVSAQNPPKVTLPGNSPSSAPIKATKVPEVPF